MARASSASSPSPSSPSSGRPPRSGAQPEDAPDTSQARVAVRAGGHGAGLVALQAFAPGDVILCFEGRLTDRPTRTSIQISEELHVDGPLATAGAAGAAGRARLAPWQCLNHSCDPNARVEAPRLVAVLPIAVGEEITFDYNTTEVDMAEPFPCACGSASCRGAMIRGFVHLPEDERIRLAPFLSPHLVRRRLGNAPPR